MKSANFIKIKEQVNLADLLSDSSGTELNSGPPGYESDALTN